MKKIRMRRLRPTIRVAISAISGSKRGNGMVDGALGKGQEAGTREDGPEDIGKAQTGNPAIGKQIIKSELRPALQLEIGRVSSAMAEV